MLNQTWPDWELILIDDGSLDNSGELCDLFAVKDSRVRTVHMTNSGASSARNTGLEMADGDYVVFLDADDRIEPNYLEKIYKVIQARGADVYLGSVRTDFGQACPTEDVVIYDAAVANAYTLDKLLAYFFGPADDAPFATWHNVYSNKFIRANSLSFDASLVWSEDRDFLLRAFVMRPRVFCMAVKGYCHRTNNSASVTGSWTESKLIGAIKVDEKWLEIASEDALLSCGKLFLSLDVLGLLMRALAAFGDDASAVLGYVGNHRWLLDNVTLGSIVGWLVGRGASTKILLPVVKVAAKLTRIRKRRLAIC